MKPLIPFALLAAAIAPLVHPASAAAAPAAGEAAERRFDASGFAAVELASSDAVRILPGATFSVTAKGEPRALSALAITVREGTLHVGRTPGRHDDRGAVVTVTMPTLRGARLSASGTIEARGMGADALTARLSGSGHLRLADLRAGQVRLFLDGSGSISASGRAERVSIDLGGSGEVDAANLATRALAVDLGGSGSVSAAADGAASIRAGGSGSVRVIGHPACAVTQGGSARVTCG